MSWIYRLICAIQGKFVDAQNQLVLCHEKWLVALI